MLGTPVVIVPERYALARSVVAGRCVNAYSTNDWVLSLNFRARSVSFCTLLINNASSRSSCAFCHPCCQPRCHLLSAYALQLSAHNMQQGASTSVMLHHHCRSSHNCE